MTNFDEKFLTEIKEVFTEVVNFLDIRHRFDVDFLRTEIGKHNVDVFYGKALLCEVNRADNLKKLITNYLLIYVPDKKHPFPRIRYIHYKEQSKFLTYLKYRPRPIVEGIETEEQDFYYPDDYDKFTKERVFTPSKIVQCATEALVNWDFDVELENGKSKDYIEAMKEALTFDENYAYSTWCEYEGGLLYLDSAYSDIWDMLDEFAHNMASQI